ncbi:hypothetical protein ACIBTV_25660 [Micromonospora sp. NPDC049366]|uniref:hypothetical protein n=1 Tax=Micromonospora sp. NPDC049366 TaxID=3364271 RepID=UPI0037AE7F56
MSRGYTTRLVGDVVYLEELRYGLRQDLGSYAAQRLELREVLDQMAVELTTSVLADKLPTEQVRQYRRERIETARFATWWDHFKATYRERWWMRWRRWRVAQLVDEHLLEAVAVVDLQRYWAFPRAAVPAPQLGEPVRVMVWDRIEEPSQPLISRPVRG